MSCLLQGILILGSLILNDQNSEDFVVYNESKKDFEIVQKRIIDADALEKSWGDLKNYVDGSFNDNELIEKFSVKDGFAKDYKYLKEKNKFLDVITLEMLKQWSENTQKQNVKLDNCEELTETNLTKDVKTKLILEAQRARTFAYAPYSEFHVGSAILTKDGRIYSGCNFENAAYGNTICAERSAIAKAISSENRGISFQKKSNIVAIAVVLRGGGGSPCGNCRQALYEFNPNMLVIMSDIDGKNIIEKRLYELLPMGFGPCALENAKVELKK
ncbi:MAG: cytidine deaminase [Parachlamydiales bacterium]|jgi:cytidine deaminase